MMIVFKKKGKKFDQNLYDSMFHNIENDLRELGFGDVTVNKKMKEFNKILYDILLKIDSNKKDKFEMNYILVSTYFSSLGDENSFKYIEFKNYFSNFFKFCFGLPLDIMVDKVINFK